MITDIDSTSHLWENHWSKHDLTSTNQLNTRYTREAIAHLMSFIEHQNKRVLEVGSGTGRFSALLARAYPDTMVVASDLSQNSLSMSRHLKNVMGLPNLSIVRANAFELPHSSEQFDVVFSQGLLPLFADRGNCSRESLVSEMRRVLRPGGTLIVAAPNWHCYPHTLYKWLLRQREIPYEYGYEKSFTRRELECFLRARGFRNVNSVSYYPSHSLYRHAGRSQLFNKMGRLVDRALPRWLNNILGFEIMTKASKQSSDVDQRDPQRYGG